jgi:hypothetical protein
MIENRYLWKGFLVLALASLSTVTVVAQNLCDSYICVVEFNTSWNIANGVGFLDDLNGCSIERISIDEGTWQADYGITTVPTVIVFNGHEVGRFQGDISFRVPATKDDVQGIVNSIMKRNIY